MKDGQIVLDGTPDDVTRAYIEEVRDADEAALLQKFESDVGNRSSKAGSEIARVSLFVGETDVNCVRIEAGCPLRIQVVARHQSIETGSVLRVRIIRLDDLLLFHNDFPVGDYVLDGGAIGLEVEFSRLVLGAAIYRLDVALLETCRHEREVCAERSTIFEVFTMDPPSGGKPMLFYPVTGCVVHT